MTRQQAILDAMRSGEWLRTQWIARVAYLLGSTRGGSGVAVYAETRRQLGLLERDGRVERRDAVEHREGEIGDVPIAFDVSRSEWRLTP